MALRNESLLDLSRDAELNRFLGDSSDAKKIMLLTEQFYWRFSHQKLYKKIKWASGFVTLVAAPLKEKKSLK